jgi:hypothetical protein
MTVAPDLTWHGDQLRYRGRKNPSVRLERDPDWSGMWRIALPDGTRSDMFNKARAKENARAILFELLKPRHVKPNAASAPLQH